MILPCMVVVKLCRLLWEMDDLKQFLSIMVVLSRAMVYAGGGKDILPPCMAPAQRRSVSQVPSGTPTYI